MFDTHLHDEDFDPNAEHGGNWETVGWLLAYLAAGLLTLFVVAYLTGCTTVQVQPEQIATRLSVEDARSRVVVVLSGYGLNVKESASMVTADGSLALAASDGVTVCNCGDDIAGKRIEASEGVVRCAFSRQGDTTRVFVSVHGARGFLRCSTAGGIERRLRNELNAL